MGRIRTVKPDFFKHYELFKLEEETGLPLRVAFCGLWTVCDREGRFKWVPQQLKIECLPYDDVDFSRVLDALTTRDFIRKYVVNGVEYGYVPSFGDHQVINNRESSSKLPEPNKNNTLTRDSRVIDASLTREVHAQAEGKGREGKGKEGNIHTSPDGDGVSVENSELEKPVEEIEEPPEEKPKPMFDEFWKTYPVKRERKKTLEIWKRKKLDSRADEIIRDVRLRTKTDSSWLKGFIPHATTYLNGERWEDELETHNRDGPPPPPPQQPKLFTGNTYED